MTKAVFLQNLSKYVEREIKTLEARQTTQAVEYEAARLAFEAGEIPQNVFNAAELERAQIAIELGYLRPLKDPLLGLVSLAERERTA